MCTDRRNFAGRMGSAITNSWKAPLHCTLQENELRISLGLRMLLAVVPRFHSAPPLSQQPLSYPSYSSYIFPLKPRGATAPAQGRGKQSSSSIPLFPVSISSYSTFTWTIQTSSNTALRNLLPGLSLCSARGTCLSLTPCVPGS